MGVFIPSVYMYVDPFTSSPTNQSKIFKAHVTSLPAGGEPSSQQCEQTNKQAAKFGENNQQKYKQSPEMNRIVNQTHNGRLKSK
jgi:hypothetical protein